MITDNLNQITVLNLLSATKNCLRLSVISYCNDSIEKVLIKMTCQNNQQFLQLVEEIRESFANVTWRGTERKEQGREISKFKPEIGVFLTCFGCIITPQLI